MKSICGSMFCRTLGLLTIIIIFSSTSSWSQAFRIPEKKEITQKAPPPNTQTTPKDTAITAKAEAKAKAEDNNDITQDPTPQPEIKNIKLVSEREDGKGNIIRVVQYTKGAMRITETVIKPKPVRIGSKRIRIDPDTMDKKKVLLVVDKTNYILKVLYKNRPIRAYRVTFGPMPKRNKCMEGDRCTPEGMFTITRLNPRSMYNKFMLINYPNKESYARFNRLKKQGKIPANAKIGSAIGIHGIWKGGDELIDMGVGWTDGCVALKNKDVDELYTMVGIGTKVWIKQ